MEKTIAEFKASDLQDSLMKRLRTQSQKVNFKNGVVKYGFGTPDYFNQFPEGVNIRLTVENEAGVEKHMDIKILAKGSYRIVIGGQEDRIINLGSMRDVAKIAFNFWSNEL